MYTELVETNQFSSQNLSKSVEQPSSSMPKVNRERVTSAKRLRVEGMCEWILRNKSCRGWLEGSGPRLLWVSDGVGKGKTMMSIFLTEKPEESVRSSDNAHLLFFFCRHDDEEHDTTLLVLRRLLD